MELPPHRIAAHVRGESEARLGELMRTMHMATSRVRHNLNVRMLPSEDDLADVVATATAMLATVQAARAVARVERALAPRPAPAPDAPTLVVVR